MQKRSELIFNLILLPIDFLAVVAAFVAAYAIRTQLDGRPVPNPLGIILFLKIFLLILPVWILIFALTGLYSQSFARSRLTELGKIFVSVSGGTMFLILVDFFSKQPIFPAKSIPIYGYGLSFVFVVLARQVVRTVQLSLFRLNVGIHRVILVGSGEIAKSIAQSLAATKKTGYQIAAVVDSARGAQGRMGKLKVYSTFEEAIKHHPHIDEILQADSALEQDEVLDLIAYASNHHLAYRFVPNQFGLFATHSRVTTMGGVPVIEISRTPLQGWGRIIKRGFDLIGAVTGLIVLSPLFMVMAILIKITDPGTVFYRQRRLSRYGKPVYIYKFRTMMMKYSTGAEFSGMTNEEVFVAMGRPDLVEEFKKENKLADDPRVSKIGKFMRRTSIDELPQLINVLKGELSLVGPRPMLEDELERFGDDLPQVLSLRCGLTGLWQLSGRTDIGFEGRVKLDLYYVENWSLGMDIRILFKTLGVILSRKGAY